MSLNKDGQYVDENYRTAPNRVVFNLNVEAERIACKAYTAFSNDPKKADEILQAIGKLEGGKRDPTWDDLNA